MPEPTYDAAHPALATLRLHMEREAAVYAQILDLARRQKAALIARDTEILLQLIAAQAPLTAEALELHRHGRDTLADLRMAWGLPAAATISDLLDRLPAEQAAALRSLRDSIARAADEIAWNYRANRLLLESAMDAVRFTMQLLVDASKEPEAGYAAEVSQRSTSLLLDQTA